MSDYNDVQAKIQGELQNLCPRSVTEQWSDDTRWTREVKEALTRLGKKLSYDCNASSVDTRDGGEWLFDVTWSRYDGEYLISLPLVCESEWGTGPGGKRVSQGFIYDFDKLLVARADLKLMVMQSLKAETVQDTIDSLIERITRFQSKVGGERYMFACWVNQQSRFTFRTHVT